MALRKLSPNLQLTSRLKAPNIKFNHFSSNLNRCCLKKHILHHYYTFWLPILRIRQKTNNLSDLVIKNDILIIIICLMVTTGS